MLRELHVAFVATECFPLVKVGGLADVVGALPRGLRKLGAHVDVVIPRFGDLDFTQVRGLEALPPVSMRFGGKTETAQIQLVHLPVAGIRVFVIEDGNYFPRPGVYVDPATGLDYPDQFERWAFFQRASLELLARESPDLDVIHCHEHQTALIPAYLDAKYRGRGVFEKVSTVFTLHNLGYQGIFPAEKWSATGLDESHIRFGGAFEYYGQVNLMKGAIVTADSITVVSPTYAKEILSPEYGCGLEGVIEDRRADLVGILNGIDPEIWNPQADAAIAARYGVESLAVKAANRKAILSELGLPNDSLMGPVLAMVSRVDAHKGFDLLLPILDDLLQRSVRFLLLGTGDPEIQESLERIVRSHPEKAAVRFVFDDAMAHRIIAGADMLLMPSRYEPCGLTQMYALQYGTVPVVRSTGGLADSVEEFDPMTATGTGFCFAGYSPTEFLGAIARAMALWNDRGLWRALMKNGMLKDLSWNASAWQYLKVYEDLASKRRPSLAGA